MDPGDPEELGAGMRKILAAESETGPGYTVSQHMEKGKRKGTRAQWKPGQSEEKRRTPVIPALYAKEGELFIQLKARLGKTLPLPQGETDEWKQGQGPARQGNRHHLLTIPHT